MLARFFIDRPVLAWVISIVIVLLGGIAAALLPIAQYPPITPPTVRVTATYPGANAQVVADTVAAPVEQQVTGVPGMLYMSSLSGNDGSYALTCTFDVGTNIDINHDNLEYLDVHVDVVADYVNVRRADYDNLVAALNQRTEHLDDEWTDVDLYRAVLDLVHNHNDDTP